MVKSDFISLLAQNKESVVNTWAGALKDMKGSSFESRPSEELTELCNQLLNGFLEALETNSYAAIRRIVTDGVNRAKLVVGLTPGEGGPTQRPYSLTNALDRLIETFNLSEVLKAFQALRPIVLKVIKEEYRQDRPQLTEAWGTMDECMGMVALQFSDIYQGEVSQLISGHLKQIESLNSRLSRLSITDGLTGLYNHKYFQYTLDKEARRTHRYGGSLSLILFDVDNFSRVNESWGYETGDIVLQAVAGTLSRSLRDVDTLARYGSEEFMAILPETSKEDAALTAERIRRELEKQTITSVTGGEVKVTVSAGVAGDQGPALDKQKLVLKVETTLTRAKEEGRNRVCAV